MFLLTELLLFAVIMLVSVFYVFIRPRNRKTDDRQYPPLFPRLPIIGSLPFIPDFSNLPEFLMKKSSELGPVFKLRFRSRVIVVLINLEAIHDAFVNHSSSFSGREGFYAEKYIINREQKGLTFMDYNADFKRYRRLALSIMKEFGFGSRSKSEDLIQTEVAELVDRIKDFDGSDFDPRELITLSVSNVPLTMILGQRCSHDEGMHEAIFLVREFSNSLDLALDFFPILRFWPPYLRKVVKRGELNARIIDLLENEVEGIMQDKTLDCFVRRYIQKEGPNYDHEQFIYLLRDLFGGSIDTTSVMLLWALTYLANYPDAAERMQEEIDMVVPRDRLPSSDDQAKLPFTEATIQEILRHRTLVPLAIPHLTLHDTEVLGQFVPANTVVISNLMSAHMNHADWPDAEAFRPERFLDEDKNVIDRNRVIAFSLGKRACPGETLARHQLLLFITGLLQNFRILPPDGLPSVPYKVDHGPIDASSAYKIRMIPRQRQGEF